MMNVATIEKTPPDKSEPPPVWWNFNQPRASDADRATVSHASLPCKPPSVSHATAVQSSSVSHAPACRATTFRQYQTLVIM